jgi:VWFA-related protein
MNGRKTLLSAVVGLALASGTSRTAGQTTSTSPAPTNSQAPSQSSATPNATQNPQPSPHSTGQPLRATTRLVQVSVVVHDKHGDPITGLTKDDFVILDDKKPQAIQVFSMRTNDVPVTPPPALPPNTYTNRIQQRAGVPTSVTVILFDGLNTQFSDQAYAKQQVVKFLRTQIQPQDRVAIFSLGHDLRTLHDFTTDSSSLLAALNAYTGKKERQLDASVPQVSDNPNAGVRAFLDNAYQHEANFFVADRVHRTVDALTQIANHVGTLPGRKNLIWVSGSFPFSIGYENVEPTPTDARELFASDIEIAARALNNANLIVYPVDARGLMTFDLGADATRTLHAQASQRFQPPSTSNFDSMNALAQSTGGRAFYNTNDIFGAIRQAIDDSRVTYELGYYPVGINWDGSFHEIKVEVKRSGAHVRARKGYFALAEPKLTPQSRQVVIASTATSPLEATGIGITIHAQPIGAGSERKLHTMLAFDPHEFNFEMKNGKWAATVDTVYLQLDDQNKIVDALDQTFHLDLLPATYERFLKIGITNTKDVAIQPKAIQLRVILRDASNGNIGSVDVPLMQYFPAKTN